MTIGTAPVSGYHAGRLAVEQTYGYMVRNAKRFGVLTTVNGFVFMFRENYGKLYMTRLVPCTVCNPTAPTVLQILYYLSGLAAQTPMLPETDTSGAPVQLDAANYKYALPAPQVPGIGTTPATSGWDNNQTAQSGQYILKPDPDPPKIVFEPWVAGNKLGGKAFLLQLVPGKTIVGKVWDGYKQPSTARDNEVAAYFKLQTLWDKQVPKFIGCGEIEFLWALLLERVEVRISNIRLTQSREILFPLKLSTIQLSKMSLMLSTRSTRSASSMGTSERTISWSKRINRLSLLTSRRVCSVIFQTNR